MSFIESNLDKLYSEKKEWLLQQFKNKLKLLYTEIGDLKESHASLKVAKVEVNESLDDIKQERDHYKREAVKLDQLYSNHT